MLGDEMALLVAIASLALGLPPAASDPGYLFAHSLATGGPRPAASAAEAHAHLRVARAFRDAGLRVGFERFAVPGKGRSRDVVGALDTPASCLRIVMAHTDSMPQTPGAVDNASGVGTLVALAPRLRALHPRCDVWLVATGSEERLYTGRRTTSARPRCCGGCGEGRASDLRIALALDEVGRGRQLRPALERARGAPARGGRGAACCGRHRRSCSLAAR